MRITHYLYNAFVLEDGQSKIAIDPGQHVGLFRMKSLIPRSVWPDISHVVVTHGDPDHYWNADRVAQASDAHVVCGVGLTKVEDGKRLVVHPRGKGLSFWIALNRTNALEVGESVELDGVRIEAVKTVHGPIVIPLFGLRLRRQPGAGERVGLGAMGFLISVGGKTVLNLGDTVLRPEWEGIRPDVLMLPIGGLGNGTWTMDVKEGLEAVRLISPKMVIPCHYNVPFLWIRNAAPADGNAFRAEVEKMGVKCCLLRYGDEIVI